MISKNTGVIGPSWECCVNIWFSTKMTSVSISDQWVFIVILWSLELAILRISNSLFEVRPSVLWDICLSYRMSRSTFQPDTASSLEMFQTPNFWLDRSIKTHLNPPKMIQNFSLMNAWDHITYQKLVIRDDFFFDVSRRPMAQRWFW